MEIFIGIIGTLCLISGVVGFIGTMVGLLLDWDMLSDWSYTSMMVSLLLAMIMSIITGG